jgi:hypothetical protein
VNGFNYYESIFFSALGSFHWETTGEGQQTAWNDLMHGLLGGPTMGEMFYRLYIEAYNAGIPAPIAALFNPTAGLHQLLTKWKPPKQESNMHRFQIHFAGGFAQTNHDVSKDGNNKEEFSFMGPFGDIGFTIVFGNPYIQESLIPYDHFELDFLFGLDTGNYIDFRILSNGYLFSFNPVNTSKNKMSTGLTLHFDFASMGQFDFFDSSINMASNAFDWTIKYQHLVSDEFTFGTKFHTGFIFMGVGDYYHPDKVPQKNLMIHYGYGINSKLYLELVHTKYGRLDTGVSGYFTWTYPGTSPVEKGTLSWLFFDAAYSYRLTKNISIGISDSFSLEKGVFKDFHDTFATNNVVKLFIAYCM